MIELLQYQFIQNALIAGLLSSIACGVIGSFVVVKRMVSISGGIAHASFGGIGLGYLLGFNPVAGALAFSLGSALVMGTVSRKTRLSADTSIGVLWATGMAMGVIFIGLAPGYAPDLFSYLFGSILTVPRSDIILMGIIDGVILLVVFMFFKEFSALSFDEEFTRILGVPSFALYLVLLCLIALTVVVLIRAVGIVLVIALITIPAAIAYQFTRSLKKMMLAAVIMGMLFTTAGLWLSYQLDIASGATIILVSAASLFISTGYVKVKNRYRHESFE
ncbi:MAG: metal ABC transporter permease [Dehalococcoidales bacterium]|jgi:zinc transport system permease protein|nr:metal ABC transporter permease [Dehalococcoidales bacterium]MDD3264766.1 metal ABC transporter permease [Dehalococcoidales bacterium]MDD4322805.1 metal ABC transporter permease [Dehalococcoidales bacterium]MDD4794495.1 metal ABC transporter permease [Dehalococcoidales bacterium]MDD5122442.1 metal ABC transporter permease [Dehalococcoidales bacterium]